MQPGRYAARGRAHEDHDDCSDGCPSQRSDTRAIGHAQHAPAQPETQRSSDDMGERRLSERHASARGLAGAIPVLWPGGSIHSGPSKRRGLT